jgi:nitrite reductase/ring-hydroxylating ferredoxin subunit
MGRLKLVHVEDRELVIANVGGKFYAIDNWCTHEEGDLSHGELKDNVVTCPEHGAQFDVTSGQVLTGPDGDAPDSISPEKTYMIRVEGDDLMVELP